MLLITLAAGLHWFPVGGIGNGFVENLYYLFLPALTLALSLSAVLLRNLRQSLADVLGAEYVGFAIAKGLPPRLILGRHVLRNAIISTITLLGLNMGTLVGGAVITESVFAIPGVGRLIIDSIFARDYPVVQGLSMVLAVMVSVVFLPHRRRHHPARPKARALIGVVGLKPLTGFLPRPATLIGLLILLLFLACALVPQLIAPYPPDAFDFTALMKPPSGAHPFGTDNFGRDILSRTIWASRIDGQIAVFCTLFPALFGTLVGSVLGYIGGWPDAVFPPPGRCLRHHPLLGHRDRHRRRARPGAAEHVHRRQRGELDHLRAPHAR